MPFYLAVIWSSSSQVSLLFKNPCGLLIRPPETYPAPSNSRLRSSLPFPTGHGDLRTTYIQIAGLDVSQDYGLLLRRFGESRESERSLMYFKYCRIAPRVSFPRPGFRETGWRRRGRVLSGWLKKGWEVHDRLLISTWPS